MGCWDSSYKDPGREAHERAERLETEVSDLRERLQPDYAEKQHQNEVRALKARNDELADLLCKAGRAALNHIDVPEDVLKWWKMHATFDERRGEPWEICTDRPRDLKVKLHGPMTFP